MRGSNRKQRVTAVDLAGQKPCQMFYQVWSSTVVGELGELGDLKHERTWGMLCTGREGG